MIVRSISRILSDKRTFSESDRQEFCHSWVRVWHLRLLLLRRLLSRPLGVPSLDLLQFICTEKKLRCALLWLHQAIPTRRAYHHPPGPPTIMSSQGQVSSVSATATIASAASTIIDATSSYSVAKSSGAATSVRHEQVRSSLGFM